jgi:hypothetical protein
MAKQDATTAANKVTGKDDKASTGASSKPKKAD